MFAIMKISRKTLTIGLIASWILMNILLYIYMGFKYAIDTVRFDEEATAWLQVHFEFSYHLWYTGYILILAISKLIFGSIYFSILFQCILSLIAVISLFNALKRIFKNTNIAFLSTLPVILYYPIQIWNMCLLTESIYVSMILLFIWGYSLLNKKKRWFYMILIAAAASITRPNGGILIITLIILYTYEQWNIDRLFAKRLFTASLLICIPCLILFIQYSTDVYFQFLIQSFNKGEIICGYDGWTIPVNVIHTEFIHNNTINQVLTLLLKYPLEYMQLACYRFLALWSDIRPYHSFSHNLYIIVSLSLLYTFAGIGLIRYVKKYSGLFILTISYCGFNSLLIMITYADWDGRFLAPLLPIVFIWSGLGIHSFFMYFKKPE
jgi:hypothetical protein